MKKEINYGNGSDIPDFDKIEIKDLKDNDIEQIKKDSKEDIEIIENIIYLEMAEKNVFFIQNRIDYYTLWDYILIPDKEKIKETYDYIEKINNSNFKNEDIEYRIWQVWLYILFVLELLDN